MKRPLSTYLESVGFCLLSVFSFFQFGIYGYLSICVSRVLQSRMTHLKRLGTVAPRRTSSGNSGTLTVSETGRGGREGRSGRGRMVHAYRTFTCGGVWGGRGGEGEADGSELSHPLSFLPSPCEGMSCLVFMQHVAWSIIPFTLCMELCLTSEN